MSGDPHAGLDVRLTGATMMSTLSQGGSLKLKSEQPSEITVRPLDLVSDGIDLTFYPGDLVEIRWQVNKPKPNITTGIFLGITYEPFYEREKKEFINLTNVWLFCFNIVTNQSRFDWFPLEHIFSGRVLNRLDGTSFDAKEK
jgi:hypothetical protein